VKTASRSRSGTDPTIYPSEDRMGESVWHEAVRALLKAVLVRFFEMRRRAEHVGSNQFVYWVQHAPTRSVAPDVYVLPECDGDFDDLSVVKTWEVGAPTFALEIVSDDWQKDYRDAPRDYDALGVEELVVFDRAAPRKRSPERVRWQVFRRVRRHGLVRVEVTNDDRVRSKVLGAWLREVGHGASLRIRVGIGPEGGKLVPTVDEDLDAKARELVRAEREIARLREELARRG
jgi:hypothetical protein